MTSEPVTLLDGRVVDSSSPDWKHECYARFITRLPRARQVLWLEEHEAKHGVEATERLRATMAAIEGAP